MPKVRGNVSSTKRNPRGPEMFGYQGAPMEPWVLLLAAGGSPIRFCDHGGDGGGVK